VTVVPGPLGLVLTGFAPLVAGSAVLATGHGGGRREPVYLISDDDDLLLLLPFEVFR
jgi:hypothetical protein